MSLVERDLINNGTDLTDLNLKKSLSANDLESSSPKSTSSDVAASLNKLLILSNPNLRKTHAQSASDANNDTVMCIRADENTENHINLVVPSPAPIPCGEDRKKI
jgi:hypothetical protein